MGGRGGRGRPRADVAPSVVGGVEKVGRGSASPRQEAGVRTRAGRPAIRRRKKTALEPTITSVPLQQPGGTPPRPRVLAGATERDVYRRFESPFCGDSALLLIASGSGVSRVWTPTAAGGAGPGRESPTAIPKTQQTERPPPAVGVDRAGWPRTRPHNDTRQAITRSPRAGKNWGRGAGPRHLPVLNDRGPCFFPSGGASVSSVTPPATASYSSGVRGTAPFFPFMLSHP